LNFRCERPRVPRIRSRSSAAAGFMELGLERADRVGVYLPKQLEAVVAMFAASKAGGVFVPINAILKAPQVGYIMRDCEVRILVTSRARLTELGEELRGCAGLRAIVLVDEVGEGAAAVITIGWPALLAAPRRAGHRVVDADMVSILYTSGSTGRPKGVVLSHRNMVTGAHSVASYLENRADDRLLAVLPFSFDYGFSQLSTAFSVGASVVLLEYLLPRDVIRRCGFSSRSSPGLRRRSRICATSRIREVPCRGRLSRSCANSLRRHACS